MCLQIKFKSFHHGWLLGTSFTKLFCNTVLQYIELSNIFYVNCYAYDITQRLQIGAQKDIQSQFRTTDCGNINDKLFNLYLRDNCLPSCFHCYYTYSCYTTSCPFKSTHISLTSKNHQFSSLIKQQQQQLILMHCQQRLLAHFQYQLQPQLSTITTHLPLI